MLEVSSGGKPILELRLACQRGVLGLHQGSLFVPSTPLLTHYPGFQNCSCCFVCHGPCLLIPARPDRKLACCSPDTPLPFPSAAPEKYVNRNRVSDGETNTTYPCQLIIIDRSRLSWKGVSGAKTSMSSERTGPGLRMVIHFCCTASLRRGEGRDTRPRREARKATDVTLGYEGFSCRVLHFLLTGDWHD
jgi:hypothetical protein